MNRRQAMQATIAAIAAGPIVTAEPLIGTYEMTFPLSDFPRLKEITGWKPGVDQVLVTDGKGGLKWMQTVEC